MSSRKLLVYLDGLPGETWYKQSVHLFTQEVQEQTERDYGDSVRGLIYAQLTGQTIEAGTIQ